MLTALATFGRWLLKWLTGGALDKALDLVDRKIDSDTERERIKGDIIAAHLATRAAYMRAGGFWLMLIFAVPIAAHRAWVYFYSALFCGACAFPKDWIVAAVPPDFVAQDNIIIASIFGYAGVLGVASQVMRK